MPAVGRRAANVVDRARRLRHPVRYLARLVERGADERRHGSGGAERDADLAAFTVDRERDRGDRDDHRVPRSDLHERLPSAGRLHAHGEDELVGGEGVLLRAHEKRLERQAPLAARACDLDLRLLDEERRKRVARRRGCAQVPAERAAILDRRRPDRPCCLGERRQRLCELGPTTVRVGQPRTEAENAVLPAPAAKLAHLVQVEQRTRARSVEVELDHDVRPAGDGQRAGRFRLEPERLVQRAWRQDVHARCLIGNWGAGIAGQPSG